MSHGDQRYAELVLQALDPRQLVVAQRGGVYRMTREGEHGRAQLLLEVRKAARALATDGPTFLNVVSPCARGWRAESADGMGLARLATESCNWPLFEVEDGRYRLSYRPRDKRPVPEWLDQQGRFSHLARPWAEQLVERLQQRVDDEWDPLLRTCDEIPEAQRQTTRDRRSCKVRAVQA